MNHHTIQEHATLYRQSDYPKLASDFSTLVLNDITFNKLWRYGIEQQAHTSEANRLFSIGKKNGKDTIKVHNYVGVLETQDGTSIEILPKILGCDTLVNIRKMLLKMLACLTDMPFINIGEAHLQSNHHPIIEIFITAFLNELERLIKKGIRRDYVETTANQNFLKGKLLFQQQLKHNLTHPERFYVQYEAFTSNTAHNRLIKSTLEKLATLSKNIENQSRIRQQLFIFKEVASSNNPYKDFQQAQPNRLYQHYRKVLNWTKVFLFNRAFSNVRGKHFNQAILFPMEQVFEAYVGKMLKKYIGEGRVLLQNTQRHLVDIHQGKSLFKLRPDIVIEKEKAYTILDTKWKTINTQSSQQNYGIEQKDMYQLFAYGKKYATTKKTKLILLYPQQQNFQQALPTFHYDPQLVLQVLPFDLVGNVEKMIRRIEEYL